MHADQSLEKKLTTLARVLVKFQHKFEDHDKNEMAKYDSIEKAVNDLRVVVEARIGELKHYVAVEVGAIQLDVSKKVAGVQIEVAKLGAIYGGIIGVILALVQVAIQVFLD